MALHIATRYPTSFAGVIALSCYLPLARELRTARNAANLATPIFMAHGTQDPVVPYRARRRITPKLLEAPGYRVEWHAYPMPHSLCAGSPTQIWLKRFEIAGVTRAADSDARLSSYRQMFTVAATFSDSMAPVPGMVNGCAPSAFICSRGRPRASLPNT